MSYIEIPRFVLIIATVLLMVLGGFGFAYLETKYGRPIWLILTFFVYFVVSVALIGYSTGIFPW